MRNAKALRDEAGRAWPGRRLAAMLTVAAGLAAGCATPAAVAPGTPRAQAIAQIGEPTARHALADGGERLEYGRDPLQQFTWMVDLDAAGRVAAVRQVRTLDNFSRLRVGVDGTEAVRREFGQPWRIERYPLSGLTAWMFPYRENGVWNSMVAVHFDDRGIVQRVENGPDPRFIGGGARED
jgi:hypothetical protein